MNQGLVNYYESVNPYGPREREEWVAAVTGTYSLPFQSSAPTKLTGIALFSLPTVNASWTGYGIGTFIGTGMKKQAAREQASLQALVALGIDPSAMK